MVGGLWTNERGTPEQSLPGVGGVSVPVLVELHRVALEYGRRPVGVLVVCGRVV